MEYTIKKGHHYSDNLFPHFTFKKGIYGSFKFTSDASYNIDKQEDTNKLIGLSDSYYHHDSSFRLGWRWDYKENKLQLMYIHYNKGVATRKPLMYINLDTEYIFKIQIKKDKYLLHVLGPEGNINEEFQRDSKWWFLRYVLYPYFGGTTKAPKDFNIEIEYILF
jgi:hypothetical protein